MTTKTMDRRAALGAMAGAATVPAAGLAATGPRTEAQIGEWLDNWPCEVHAARGRIPVVRKMLLALELARLCCDESFRLPACLCKTCDALAEDFRVIDGLLAWAEVKFGSPTLDTLEEAKADAGAIFAGWLKELRG